MNKSSIKQNFAYQMIYEVLIFILPLITSPYIARVIGAEGVGIYSYSYSIAYYFVLVSMLGIKNYGNRAIAKARDDKELLDHTFTDIVTLHIFVALLCTLAYIIYALTRRDGRIYALIQFFYVFSAIFDISWFYFGIEKFKLTVTRNTIIRCLNVICVFLFVKNKDDLWKYCLIMSLGNLISQLALWIPLRGFVRFTKPDLEKIKTHVKPLLILFIPAIAVSLYKYMDKIMIGSMSSKIQLGYYENAEKVINIPLTIIVSFGTVMLPKMSNLAASKNSNESQKYISRSMQYVMCLAFALSFGLAAVGRVFAPVFWGKAFSASGTIIMGLSSTIPFISFANVIRTQYLIPNERDREYLTSVIAGAFVNLVINWLLIPQYGANGAMIGTIFAEVTVCLIQGFYVRKELPLFDYIKRFAFFLLLGAAMFAIVFTLGRHLKTGVLTLLVQIVVGAVFFSVGTYVFFSATKDPIVLNINARIRKVLGGPQKGN